ICPANGYARRVREPCWRSPAASRPPSPPPAAGGREPYGLAVDAGDAAHPRQAPEYGGVAQGHDVVAGCGAGGAAGRGPLGDVDESAAHRGEAGEEAEDLLPGPWIDPGVGAPVDRAGLLCRLLLALFDEPVRDGQVGAGGEGVAEDLDHVVGLLGVLDEVEDGDEQERDRLG